MKRFLILAFLVLAIGAWAAPITYNGQLTYGFTFNGENNQNSYANAYIWLTGNVSEDTLAKVKLAANFRNLAGNFPATFQEFFVSQNIGKFLGTSDPGYTGTLTSLWIDMGVKDMVSVSYPPSDFSLENVSGYDPGAMDVVALRAVIAGKLNINTWVNPMGVLGVPLNANSNPARFALNAYGPIGPFTPSVWYATNGHTFEEGKFGTSIGFNTKLGDVGITADAEATYDLFLTDNDDQFIYALAGAATYGIVGLGSEFKANLAGMQVVAVEFRLTPVKWFGINTGAEFDVRPNAVEVFDSMELGGWFRWQDGLKFRFGYLYTKTGGNGYSMYCPNPLKEGGFFLKCDMSF